MKQELVRFGIAMDAPLLEQLDRIVEARGATRSELLRDLVRAEVARAQIQKGVHAVATLTIVYDHHVRDLTDRLTALQHELGERVRSTLHVHLSPALCLEVIVMRGWSEQLKSVADRILATRGVKHGGLQMIAEDDDDGHPHRHRGGPKRGHGHAHPHR